MHDRRTLAVLAAVALAGLLLFVPSFPDWSVSYHRYVGFRCNGEGTPQYWVSVAKRYSSAIPDTAGGGIWIVASSKVLVYDVGVDDALSVLDGNNVKVFLQAGEETPGVFNPYPASVDMLIDKILENYGRHSCVVGVGVDLEQRGQTWDDYEAAKTSDAEATRWLNKVKAYNAHLKLFLKHWLTWVMPPTARKDIVFVDMKQNLGSLNNMIAKFKEWGNHFAASDVAFQVGYPSDRIWWFQLSDPSMEMANAIFRDVPNAKGVYWVNVGGAIYEVFPL